jgi:hypothetical protein
MLKKYDELTEAQQAQVRQMYQNNAETIRQFLYNFDATGKYTGRQFAPETGVIHAESVTESRPSKTVVIDINAKDDSGYPDGTAYHTEEKKQDKPARKTKKK